MKKSIVVLLCVLMLAIGATASNTVNAILGTDIKVNLEGKALSLKDAKGNQVYPLVFNGTTYLPVRAVAENLGLNVGWDNNTKTVSLSKTGKETTAKQKDVYGLNEWWEVPGLWKVKIDSVEVVQKKNNTENTEEGERVKIKYTYENLGYKGGYLKNNKLNLLVDNVLDENKKVGTHFINFSMIEEDDHSAKDIPIGAICEKATTFYLLPSKNNKTIKIFFSEYGEEYGKDLYEATFEVPVNR